MSSRVCTSVGDDGYLSLLRRQRRRCWWFRVLTQRDVDAIPILPPTSQPLGIMTEIVFKLQSSSAPSVETAFINSFAPSTNIAPLKLSACALQYGRIKHACVQSVLYAEVAGGGSRKPIGLTMLSSCVVHHYLLWMSNLTCLRQTRSAQPYPLTARAQTRTRG